FFPMPSLGSVGGEANIYGQYYVGQNSSTLFPEGDPRPFQTAPLLNPAQSILVFSGTSFNAPVPGQPLQPGTLTTNAQDNAQLTTSPAFPSGHTTFGFTQSLMFAIMVPEAYQQQITRASEYGYDRIVMAAHYPTDVIGGRILATYGLAQALDPANTLYADFQAEFATATVALRNLFTSQCGGLTISACIASGAADRFADYATNKANYLYRLTYDLPATGPTDLAPVVPSNAYLLLTTRFPYLSSAQITEVLYTTEIASGAALDDGSGWARLNLFDAASGYGAFRSTVTVSMDAALGGFNAYDTWQNDIGGAGGLVKQGTGTLVLAGTNNYQGGTLIQGGMLGVTGSIVGAVSVSSGATLMTGPSGQISTSGLGNVTNAGAIVNYGTIVGDVLNSGTVTNNGILTGTFTNGGLLGGNGVINGTLANAGIVAPGNSIGTMNVNGAVSFSAGSSYQVEIGAPGQSDLIAATGPVSISGAALNVVAGVGATPQLGSYTILTSGTGVTGTFASVNDPFGSAYPFLDLVTTSSANAVGLNVVADRAALVGAGRSPNERAVGAALGSLQTSSPVLQAVVGLNGATAPAAFDALSGQIYASTATVLQEQSIYLRDALGARLRQASSGTPQSAGPQAVQLAPGFAATAWLQGYGSWGDTDATANSASLSRNVGGLFAGIDAPVGDTWRLGIAGGYSQSTYDLDALNSSGTSDNYDIAGYASTKLADMDLRLGAAYSWHDISTSRTVLFSGFLNGLSSDSKAGTTQVFGEIAKSFGIGGASLEPFAGLAYVHLNMESFTEGGGAAALTSGGLTQDNTFSTLGLRVSQSIAVGTGTLTARGSLAWQYAFGDITPDIGLALATGSAPFTVSGAPIGRNAALVNVGLDFRATANLVLGLSYGGQFAENGSDNALNARLAVSF
ncbi:autotransporter domain-containing protein, partial [Xanthobacter sp. DSM 24535]|uniref:autotransporter domain-containing protein n=1 Tax=Roseixanthobacter psychrophilus TaxID=3119917 RepID=UPI003728A57C